MPDHRKLDRHFARGMLAVALFAAVAGAARVGQDAAIAWRYGTGSLVDAYYFITNLAAWPVAVALSTLTLLVAPTDAALNKGEASLKKRFRGELLGAVLVAAVMSLPLAWWALHTIAGSQLSGLDDAAATFARAGVPAIVATVPVGLLGALLAAWLVAAGRHLLTLLEALAPLVLICTLLAWPGPVIFWGTTAGVVLQVAAMAVLLQLTYGLPRPQFGISAPAWSGFSQGAVALLAGQMIFALIPLVDPLFAAQLGDGAVASISFANRLVLGLQGLAGLALQRAGLPMLSRLTVTSPAESLRMALRWSAAAALVGLAMGLVLAALADPLVSLLYERGRFTAADREQVAMLLRFGMFQMPPFLAGLVLFTALASARGGSYLAVAAVVGLAVKLAFSTILAAKLGLTGLLLATALMYTATTGLGWAVVHRQTRLHQP